MKDLVRISNTDLPGQKQIHVGLSRVYGLGKSFAHAVCIKLNIEKSKKIGDLTEQEIKSIDMLIKDPSSLPKHLLNRRYDPETGKTNHLTGPDLKLRTEFDVRKMKKLKTYKGIRHGQGQPVRGQRTKSHFRTGSSVGVVKKGAKVLDAAKGAEKKKDGK